MKTASFLLFAFAVGMPSPLPGQAQVTDFALTDVNLGSLRRRVTSVEVSPRNYLHQVTGWYFGWEG